MASYQRQIPADIEYLVEFSNIQINLYRERVRLSQLVQVTWRSPCSSHHRRAMVEPSYVISYIQLIFMLVYMGIPICYSCRRKQSLAFFGISLGLTINPDSRRNTSTALASGDAVTCKIDLLKPVKGVHLIVCIASVVLLSS